MTETAQHYMGSSVLRKEDPALLTGHAGFTDDIHLPGMLHFALLRSPHAHAKVLSVDVSAARERPGVVAVFTGEDLAEEWAIGIPTGWPVTEDIKIPDHWPLARGEVNHAGDGVAVVVATDRYRAQDALESIDVEYEVLPVVVDVEAALEEGSPLVHEDLGTNKCYTWPLGTGDIDKAFEEADVVVSGRYIQQRLIPSAIEPRAVVVNPEPATGALTVYSSTQVPHFVKDILALVCGVSETKLRVVAPEVGGGFGGKLNVYAEEALALALARRLKTPVKWVEDRSENHLASTHGRGQVQHIQLAAKRDGKILGMKVKLLADMGAYLQLLTPGIAIFGSFTYPGLYTFDAYSFECTGVFTNLTPTDAYRGAGRSEAAYAHERIMDDLARELGMDPAELRIMNLIPPFDEPTTTPAGVMYDSGDYETCMRKALDLAGYDDLRAEQRRRREAGDVKQLGVGIGNFTESGGLSPSKVAAGVRLQSGGWESASVRMSASGKVEVVTGTSPHGQGHETSWSQIAADAFGVDFDDVEVLHGDTAIAPYGRDTYGSRSLAVGGVALSLACGKVVDKAKKIAAHMLEAAEDDIEFENGRFSVAGSPGTNVSIQDVAAAAYLANDLPEGMEPVLSESHVFDPPNFTWPYGTHVCAVEVDTETGRVTIPKYVAVDDCGPVVNPAIVDGQLHGGIAQGIAQALYEEAVYDSEGNLVTGTMMNYMIPGAPEIPNMILDRTETPSPTNPMGVKGIGESGAIAAQPAVVNAVIDAVSHLGVTHIDMPASPWKVWQAIQDAKNRDPGATNGEV
ncbi:MAG: xanthine dehydrogenase family protein molybdopterin-binding subunit [Rubrobacter sp.]|jgi:carbon-monoxide dehydrogenase large subunit|nr:xanthine dehydrogenase family protein molybdopterin-binding subunit [Rubrobacter sp.]MDQ3361095.1 xanthine dehydrogenase family protein molybdopterin-binding subunit [Actinomycetota bacterium]MDQ3376626.1 xanthine dehydrogenase family protein molybdopterin-binding subunit [Actinomycetota bacterium]